MKKTALFIACAGLIVGLSLADPKPASAGIRISFGSGGYGGYGYSNRGYSNYGYSNFNRGYSSPFNRGLNYGGSFNRGFGHGHYGRGHYDYHPPALVPHGNHFHVIPGHYDYHRGGHHGHH